MSGLTEASLLREVSRIQRDKTILDVLHAVAQIGTPQDTYSMSDYQRSQAWRQWGDRVEQAIREVGERE